MGKVTELLGNVSKEIGGTLEDPKADQVHDLRTSIRRLRETLRVFADFFPSKPTKAVRKELQTLMHLAAEIRNRDITLELIQDSGISNARLAKAMQGQRNSYRKKLLLELERIRDGSLEKQWKAALGL